MATQTDIEIVQGQTKVFSATWMVDDDPKSLEGFAAHLQVRKRPGSFTADPLIDISSEGDDAAILMEPGSETGMVRVRIPAQLTATLRKNCWYSLFVVNKSDPGEAARLAFGQVTISLSSTDNTEFITHFTEDLSG